MADGPNTNKMWDWKPWYAWYPIKIQGRWVWLKWVQRRKEWVLSKPFVHESYIGWGYRR